MSSPIRDVKQSEPGTPGCVASHAPACATRSFGRALLRSEFWIALLACGLVLMEADQTYLEPLFVWGAVNDMTFRVEAGPSPSIRFPQSGPYDRRLGYTALPSLIQRMSAHDFAVERQARQSAALVDFVGVGGYAVYHEKSRAGLVLKDRSGQRLEAEPYPAAVYERFEQIPPVLVDTLRFIEDRDLLDPKQPYRNPAVEWRRFALAAAGRIGSVAPHHLSFMGSITAPGRLVRDHAPEAARLLRGDGVDVALLVPV